MEAFSKAAATPRPSAIPTAAMIGTVRRSTRRGSSANRPTACRSASLTSNVPQWPPASAPWSTTASAPAASAASASDACGRASEPRDSACLQSRNECRRIEAHHGRHDGRAGLKHRCALGIEVRRSRVRGLGRDRRSPSREKLALPSFQDRVADGWRIRFPEVDLTRAIAASAKCNDPFANAR